MKKNRGLSIEENLGYTTEAGLCQRFGAQQIERAVWAEIIPIEPDTDNAETGMHNQYRYPFSGFQLQKS